ncbi:MAG: hypothetical protein KIT33_13505 [Candidatus Kapabacteria bacterium]|nr:hypothetical protein [Ignavibacteriota bacterium]MCW5885981.1 hypothetical protein [Candidatus Kapabacteria bacterium]
MSEKYINIAKISGKCLTIGSRIFSYTIGFFALILFSRCDTCIETSGNGNTPEELVYFSAAPVNSSLPNVYQTDGEGSFIDNLLINGITFSAPSDNGKITYIRKDIENGNSSLFISNIDGSNQNLIVSDNDIFSVSFPVISSNGRYIAFNAGNSRLFVYDVESGSPTFNQITGRLAQGSFASFSNNSQYFAYIEGDGSATAYTVKVAQSAGSDNLITKYSKSIGNIDFAGESDLKVNWSDDSQQIIFSVKNGSNDDIYLIDINSGTERIVSIPNENIGGKDASLSPKNDFLAVSGRDGNIWLIFTATNDLRYSNITRTDGFERYHSPKWSWDGSKVLYNSTTLLDSDIYSTLICSEINYELALASIKRSYILSSNAFKGFWSYRKAVL